MPPVWHCTPHIEPGKDHSGPVMGVCFSQHARSLATVRLGGTIVSCFHAGNGRHIGCPQHEARWFGAAFEGSKAGFFWTVGGPPPGLLPMCFLYVRRFPSTLLAFSLGAFLYFLYFRFPLFPLFSALSFYFFGLPFAGLPRFLVLRAGPSLS